MVGSKGKSKRSTSRSSMAEWAKRTMEPVVGVDNVEIGDIPRSV